MPHRPHLFGEWRKWEEIGTGAHEFHVGEEENCGPASRRSSHVPLLPDLAEPLIQRGSGYHSFQNNSKGVLHGLRLSSGARRQLVAHSSWHAPDRDLHEHALILPAQSAWCDEPRSDGSPVALETPGADLPRRRSVLLRSGRSADLWKGRLD